MDRKIVGIPVEVLNAIDEGKLVLFIGAGFSRLCGLPSWRELAEKLVDDCVLEHVLNYSEASILKHEVIDSKQLITIAYQYFLDASKKDDFFKKLSNHLTLKSDNEEKKILLDFVRKTQAYVLTTNADSILHECFETQLIHFDETKIEDWIKITVLNATLIHLHGSILRDSSMVFTAENYLKRYRDKNFIELLSMIFNGKQTILFIGYGANELELLDYLLLKSNATDQDHNRYILNGYYDHEQTFQTAMSKYYHTLNIEQISYSKNLNNYSELALVLKDWLVEIETFTNLKAKSHKRLMSIVKKQPTQELIVDFTQYCAIDNPSEYKAYFVEMQKSIYSKEWISEIYKAKKSFFALDRFQPAQKTDKGYKSLDWPAFTIFVDLYIENYRADNDMFLIATDLVGRVVDHLLSNIDLFTNTYVVHALTKLVFSHHKLIESVDVIRFLSELCKSPFAISTQFIQILSQSKPSLLQCDSKLLLDVLYITFSFIELHDDTRTTYEFELFSKAYKEDLSARFPERIFDDFVIRISVLLDRNQFEYSSMGSLFLYPNDVMHEDYDYKTELLTWIKSALSHMNRDALRQRYSSILPTNHVLCRIPIYIATIRFDEVFDLFFGEKDNPFNDWNRYADLCFLIQNNANKLSSDQVRKFSEWISNANFGRNDESQMFIDACKYEAMQLLSKSINASAIRESSLIGYREEFSTLDKFYDRNKLFRIQSGWENNDKDIEKELLRLDFDGLCDYLNHKQFDFEHDKYRYHRALTNVFKTNHEILKETITHLSIFHIDFLESVISAIKEDITIISDTQRISALQEMVSILTREPNSRNPLVSIIWLIRERGLYKSHSQDSYDVCLRMVQYAIKHPEQSKVETYSKHPYTTLINNFFYIGLDMLLFSAMNIAQFNGSFLSEQLEEWSSIKGIESIFKASIASHIPRLELLCSDWLKTRVNSIFDNTPDNVHLSYVCFALHPSYSDFAYNSLENELSIQFSKNVNSNDTDIKASAEHLMTWYLRRYLQSGELTPHFCSIMKQVNSSVLSSLFRYFSRDAVKEEGKLHETISFAEKLVNFLITIDLFGETSSDQAIREVCAFIAALPSGQNKSLYWNYAIKLCIHFRSYLSDEIIHAIEVDHTLYKYETLIFLYELAKSSDEWAFQFDVEKIRKITIFFADDASIRSEYNKWINELAKHNKEYYQFIR